MFIKYAYYTLISYIYSSALYRAYLYLQHIILPPQCSYKSRHLPLYASSDKVAIFSLYAELSSLFISLYFQCF